MIKRIKRARNPKTRQ
jgi:hypothetical protein